MSAIETGKYDPWLPARFKIAALFEIWCWLAGIGAHADPSRSIG